MVAQRPSKVGRLKVYIITFQKRKTLKKCSRIFFENAQTFCFREEFSQIQKQNVLHDEISTLVGFYWIRVTRTILRVIRPLCRVVVTPLRISENREPE